MTGANVAFTLGLLGPLLRRAPRGLRLVATLATLFVVLCILSNFLIDHQQVQESVIQQRAQQGQTQQAPVLPPADQPGGAQQPAPQRAPRRGRSYP